MPIRNLLVVLRCANRVRERPRYFQEKRPCLKKNFPTLEKVFSTLEKIFSRHGKKISSVSVFLENIPAFAARYSVTTMRDGRRGKQAVDGG